MNSFDPYFTFRLALTFLLAGYVIYDLICLVVWYRELPRFAQRVMLLKLLQFRSGSLKKEFSLIALLTVVAFWLMTQFVTGV